MEPGVPPELLVVDFSSEGESPEQIVDPNQDDISPCLLVDDAQVAPTFSKDRALKISGNKTAFEARNVSKTLLTKLGIIHSYVSASALIEDAKDNKLVAFTVEIIPNPSDSETVSVENIAEPGTIVFNTEGKEIGVVMDVFGSLRSPLYMCAQPPASVLEDAAKTDSPFFLPNFPTSTEVCGLKISNSEYPIGTEVCVLASCPKVGKKIMDEPKDACEEMEG